MPHRAAADERLRDHGVPPPWWLANGWALRAYLVLNALLMIAVYLSPPALAAVPGSAVSVLATTAVIVGIQKQRPDPAAGWWLVAAGTGIGGVVPLSAAVFQLADLAIPHSPFALAASGVSQLCLIAGVAFIGRRGSGAGTADLLDATMVALAVFVILFAWFIHPVLPAGNWAVTLAVTYPLAALLLFTMALWVLLGTGRSTLAIRLLVMAVSLRVAALVSMQVPALASGSLQYTTITPWLWIAYSVLVGSAGLHPSLGQPRPVRAERHDTVSKRRVLLLVTLAALAPVAWATEIWRPDTLSALGVTVVLVFSAVLLVLLVARLALTAGVAQRRAAELAQRSTDLTEAVQEQRALEQRLRYQAMHDPLTGLPNRVSLTERMRQVLDGPAALAILDLDRFKDVNDTFGHAVGDELLVAVSERLRSTLPVSGTVARMGGDEFAVLLEGGSAHDAAKWSDQVCRSIRQPLRVSGHDLHLSASVGMLITDPGLPCPTPSEALRDADLALYAAKAAGRDRVVTFHPELRAARTDLRALITDLQQALNRDELMVNYQPMINLSTGDAVAVEAMLQWRRVGHPTPLTSELISVAEDTGLIRPLGAWVMQRACREARQWYDDHHVSVAVNVSARQLDDSGFVDMVTAALRESGLPGHALILQITETSLVAASHTAPLRRLHALRHERGVRVAIDDFGTGTSSLASLLRLPIDIVKIDSAFLDGSPGDGGWTVTRSICHLAETLRLQAVAEGVETPEQAAALRELGSPWAQGGHFARPMHRDALTSSWRRGGR